jgi:methylisocitrate lyase
MLYNGVDKCKQFRKLLEKGGLCLPGAHSGLIGRMAAAQGFEALYVSGGALSAMTGQPDIGFPIPFPI